MQDNGDATQDNTLIVEAPAGRSGVRRIGAAAGWSIVFLGSLAFFTILKFPDARLKAFVQDSINSAIAPQGISLIARSSSLSVIFGVKYQMEDVSLYFRDTDRTVKLESLRVSPSLLSMAMGKIAGSARATDGDGTADISFSMAKSAVSLNFDVEDFDLGKIGLLAATSGMRAGARIAGYGELSGDFTNLATLSGDITVKLSGIKINEQKLSLFPIPEINVSEGELRLRIRSGKINVREFRLGKDGKDDLRGTLKGDIQLGRQINASNVKATTTLYLSERLRKAPGLSAVDLILGQYRQSDGGYCVDLSGSLMMPSQASCASKK